MSIAIRRSALGLLVVALMLAQFSCRGLLGGNSGSETSVAGGGRPAPHFTPGFNLFKPEQDVELGRESAAKVAQQVPLLRDERITNYVRQLGAKLAAKAPGYSFPYQFSVVASKEINAFALPGGFVFVNAGALAAAKNEGEIAGVIAHEISHVALRHGTNQASKAYLAQAGLDILRNIAGGADADLGQIVDRIGGTGANMLFLKFGRSAETQADLEGAHIMADAGYDPRDMANFFKTLEAQGGERAPQWMSDHPDPGNRVAAINNLLPQLRLSQNPTHDTDAFRQAKALLTGNASALNSGGTPERVGPRDPGDMKAGTRPERPASAFREFQTRDGSFALRYPQNWDVLTTDQVNLIFAPKGAYGQREDAVFVTHGLFIGAVAPQSDDLTQANARFVEDQIKVNPDFRIVRQPEAVSLGGRRGYRTMVAGPSTVTGVMEVDVIHTTATSDGQLFYLIAMAPEDEWQAYEPAFAEILGSLKLR
ncbi:MAG TPA: M48 family metallopeptidase [Pyrinomonadaceae bacterium]